MIDLERLVICYEGYREARKTADDYLEDWERAQQEMADTLPVSGRCYLGTHRGYAVIYRGAGHTGRGPLFEMVPEVTDET